MMIKQTLRGFIFPFEERGVNSVKYSLFHDTRHDTTTNENFQVFPNMLSMPYNFSYDGCEIYACTKTMNFIFYSRENPDFALVRWVYRAENEL